MRSRRDATRREAGDCFVDDAHEVARRRSKFVCALESSLRSWLTVHRPSPPRMLAAIRLAAASSTSGLTRPPGSERGGGRRVDGERAPRSKRTWPDQHGRTDMGGVWRAAKCPL